MNLRVYLSELCSTTHIVFTSCAQLHILFLLNCLSNSSLFTFLSDWAIEMPGLRVSFGETAVAVVADSDLAGVADSDLASIRFDNDKNRQFAEAVLDKKIPNGYLLTKVELRKLVDPENVITFFREASVGWSLVTRQKFIFVFSAFYKCQFPVGHSERNRKSVSNPANHPDVLAILQSLPKLSSSALIAQVPEIPVEVPAILAEKKTRAYMKHTLNKGRLPKGFVPTQEELETILQYSSVIVFFQAMKSKGMASSTGNDYRTTISKLFLYRYPRTAKVWDSSSHTGNPAFHPTVMNIVNSMLKGKKKRKDPPAV